MSKYSNVKIQQCQDTACIPSERHWSSSHTNTPARLHDSKICMPRECHWSSEHTQTFPTQCKDTEISKLSLLRYTLTRHSHDNLSGLQVASEKFLHLLFSDPMKKVSQLDSFQVQNLQIRLAVPRNREFSSIHFKCKFHTHISQIQLRENFSSHHFRCRTYAHPLHIQQIAFWLDLPQARMTQRQTSQIQ